MVSAIPRWLVAAFVAMMFVTLGEGAWFYYSQRQSCRQDARVALESIARLKMEEIVQWRQNQLGEAAELMTSRFFIEGVTQWLAEPSAETRERILSGFRGLCSHQHYADVLLVDTGGRVLLSLYRRMEPLPSEALRVVATALRERKPILTDFYMGSGSVPRLEVVAPLFGGGVPPKPVGAVVLRSDARESVYPLVRTWPVPSHSAETLLVRRDGDDVLFLNELRHRQDTALKLRIPLAGTEVPAVMAVLGTEGVVQGRDYRGVEVLAVLNPIPDSPWFLVTKEDTSEVFAAWHFRSFLILGMILGCVLIVTAGMGIVWQRNLKAHYRTLFQAETGRREIEKLYRSLFDNMLNGFACCRMIYEEGRPKDLVYLAVNNAFGALTGLKDVVGKKASEVIPGVWEKDMGLLEIYGRVARTGAPEKFEICLESLKMWFSISVYRPQEGHFVAVFDVITRRKQVEQALRESEALVRSITDHSEDMIFVKDRDSRYLFMNPAGVRLTDVPLEEILGRRDSEWNPNVAEAAAFMAVDSRVISLGQTETVEEEVTTPAGKTHIMLTKKTPRLDPEGNVIGLVGICRDITQRKQAEGALRESEERFRTLYASMTEIAALHEIVTDSGGQAVDYRILDCNPAFTKVTRISRDRAIGALASELYGMGKAPFLDIYARVAATGEPASFEAFFDPIARHFEISVFSPRRGRFATVAGDITDRKQAEHRLAKQQALLEGMNRVLREAIRCETEMALAEKCLTVARELTGSQFGIIHELNAAGTLDNLALTDAGWGACKMPQSEAVVLLKGMPVRGVWARTIHMGETVMANDSASHPDRVELPSGHPPLHRFLGVPLKMGEKSIGLIGLANKPSDYDVEDQQVTESLASAFVEALQRLRARQQTRALNAFLDGRVRERTAQLETANKELESFSYSVSHDLRAPLRAISGFAGILAEDFAQRLTDEGRRVLDTITSEARRMGQLIDDLLEFSRVGRRPMQAAEVDMNALAQGAFNDCASQAPGRDLRFKLHPLPAVQGDAAMLRQVWTNLISNAVKYTRPRPVAEIEITCCADKGEFVFCVKDNGTGFDMQYVQKLFGVFQRLHDETEFEGTGVGLALVQRIVQRHGGRVWAEAALNEGAAFRFSLPAGKG